MGAGVIVFDVNETLLDLGALDPVFERVFSAPGMRPQWFAQLLHWSMVTALSDGTADFGTLAARCLDALAAARGLTLQARQRDLILEHIQRLPAHDDAIPALQRLSDAGLRLAALTNSNRETARGQLRQAGLDGYFEAILSVQAAGSFKPDLRVYRYAGERLAAPAAQLRLVAAHDWDITGAMRAGWRSAYVARDGAAAHPNATLPDIVGRNLIEVAQHIVAADAG